MSVQVDAAPYNRAELSDDEIKQQEELIKLLKDPDTLTNFVEACKKIGQTAVAIDNDFIAVKNSFDDFVKTYGNNLPKVKSDFVPQWAGFMAVSQYFLFWAPLNNFRVR